MIKALLTSVFPNKIVIVIMLMMLSVGGLLYYQSSQKDDTIGTLNEKVGTLESDLRIEKGKVLSRDLEITRLVESNKIFEDQRAALKNELSDLLLKYGTSEENNKKLQSIISKYKNTPSITKTCVDGSSVEVNFEEVMNVQIPSDVINFINGSDIRLQNND